MLSLIALLPLLAGDVGRGVLSDCQGAEARDQTSESKATDRPAARDRIRDRLREIAERVRDDALEQVKKNPNWVERDGLRSGVRRVHFTALRRIDQLLLDFERLEGTHPEIPLIKEVQRLLADDGLDSVLSFLDRHREVAISRDRTRLEEFRAGMTPFLLATRLKAINGQSDSARKEFEEMLKLDPTWDELLRHFCWFLHDQATAAESREEVSVALVDAEQAKALSERLNADGPNAGEVWRIQAIALWDMGNILSQRGRRGDAGTAGNFYSRSLKLYESWLKQNPESVDARRGTADVSDLLATHLSARGHAGDEEFALELYTRSLELRESLLKTAESADAKRDVIETRILLGRFLWGRGQPGDEALALRHVADSLELAESLLRADPDSIDARHDAAECLASLGSFLSARAHREDSDEAFRHFARSLAIRESLLAVDPDSVEAHIDVVMGLSLLGNFLSSRGQSGDRDEAYRQLTRSLEIGESLLQVSPDSAVAKRYVAYSLDRLGAFLLIRGLPGDTEASLRCCNRSLELHESLLKENLDSVVSRQRVSVNLIRLGSFLASRGQFGDLDRAFDCLYRSLELRESDFKDNPESAWAKRDMAVCLEVLGDILSLRDQPGDSDEAFRHYARSLAIRETLPRNSPGAAWARRLHSLALYKLANFLSDRGLPGDDERALKYYTQELELSESLVKDNPDAAWAKRELSASLEVMGDYLLAREDEGDQQRAAEHFSRSLEIREAILKDNPGSAEAVRDVAIGLEKSAKLLLARRKAGDVDEALRQNMRALELSQALLRDNPEQALAARDVALSYFNCARVHLVLGDRGAAERHRRACFDLLKPRISAGMQFDAPIRHYYEMLRAEFEGGDDE